MRGRKHKHKRRDRYWQLYDFAHSKELTVAVDELARLVDEAGDPYPQRRREPKRGRRPVHSPRKMAVICVLMVILGFSYRRMEALLHLHMLRLPWPLEASSRPVPDHSTIHEAFRRIPEAYLKRLLASSAAQCIAEAGWVRGVVAADGTGVLTDRYETVEVKVKKTKRRISVKYHVVAILDYNIIMSARIKSRRTADSPTLRSTLKRLPPMEGSIFNADRGCDADRTCELVYALREAYEAQH